LIAISIGLNKNLTLCYYRASGHAKHGKPGEDLVCAAVTCLLKTAAGILFTDHDLKIDYKAEKSGQMELNIIQIPEYKVERVKGITDFLLKGLIDLEGEYPDNLSIDIQKATS
jgi:uncharacterized protein YsxB (DUF464 family)